MQSCAVFPGQGAQHVGMSKELHDNFKCVREAFEEASDAIKRDLKKLCFEGPESELTLTENTQPCLLTASVAAFRVAETEYGYKPKAVAGHSLGEYSALTAIGYLPLSLAVRWVHERGKAMQSAVPAGLGGMAAGMGLDDEKIKALCEKTEVEAANFNAPGQTVVSGKAEAIQAAVALIKSGAPEFKGGKVIPLQVSAPFHSSLMAPARERMAKVFAADAATLKNRALACPYVPNRTARLTSEPGVVLELLIEQIDHTVLWRQSYVELLRAGCTHTAEFGPGNVLTGLAKRIAAAEPTPVSVTLVNVRDLAGVKQLQG